MSTSGGKSLKELNEFFSCVPGIFYWKDWTGLYLGCNKNYLKLLNFETKDFIGKTDQELWPEHALKLKQYEESIIAGHGLPPLEIAILLGGNTQKFINITMVSWVEDYGNILIANVVDITDQKNNEKILTEKHHSESWFFEKLIDGSPGNLYWKDKSGVYLGCNQQMVQVSNLQLKSQIIGKSDVELWPNNADYINDNDQDVFDGRTSEREETVNGRTYLSVKMPLRDHKDEIIGLIGNSLDITYLKQIESELKIAKEKTEAACQAKSEFLAIVSHELRSPLTIILGMIHFLCSKENLSEEQKKEYINHISVTAKHLLTLANDFLDFSKLDAGKFELTLMPLDLKQLISETITIFIPQASAKGLDIFIDYEHSVPHMIFGDSRALRQIMFNLLSNAIKFTDVGFISVKVECFEAQCNTARLCISVTDTGVGIPKEKLSIIFDDFQQVDSSYRRQYGGTGLGLAITKKIINIMDGSLSVQSEENQGSTFNCDISFTLQEKAIVEQPWKLHQAYVPILIVDDSHRGHIIRKQIGSGNCQVATSNNALNFFIVNQQSPFPCEIVIIDDQTVYNPYELAKKFSECSYTKNTMLVLLTSSATLSVKSKAEQAGFFECFVKPIQPLELQISLTAAWEKWREKYSPQLFNIMNARKNRMCDLNKKRILLIDDEKTVLFVHSEILKDLGCDVEAINDGYVAGSILESDAHFDIIMVDMGLPGISGPELVKLRRNRESMFREYTPIVALTGYSSQEDRETFLKSGVDEVLLKPITPGQLHTVLIKYGILEDVVQQ